MTRYADELERLRPFADTAALPRAWGLPLGRADLRTAPADFEVIEEGGLVHDGTGEHLYLRVRKTGQNTRWVARRIAELAGVPYRAVSYAGLKDRHALTEQWFSIHVPGRDLPPLATTAADGFQVVESRRHSRKLHTGQLSFNRFGLLLRNCTVTNAAAADARLQQIGDLGVPNYFGPQRFGRDLGNLHLFDGVRSIARMPRDQRAFGLSALRGALFNGYLAGRVTAGSWRATQPGDVQVSDRPRGVAELDSSVFSSERQPAGLLWGRSPRWAEAAAGEAEQAYFAAFPEVTALLERAGSRPSRRVLRARVGGLRWTWQEDGLRLEFALGPGSYATMVLRELLDVMDRANSGGAEEQGETDD